MKRHEALAPLSRDHHHALVVAQGLSRATDGDAAQAAAAFTDYFDADGRRHFAQEEDVVLPVFAAHVLASDPMIVRTLTDHVAIRRDAAALAAGAPTDVLRSLGRRLSAHVRFEERELFPRIEGILDEAELAALAARLESPAA